MSAPCPVLGFVVQAILHATTTDADADALRDDFVDLLETNDLSTGGGGDRRLEYAVTRDGGQATQADRELVLAWAVRWAHVAQVAVSDLVDLNRAA